MTDTRHTARSSTTPAARDPLYLVLAGLSATAVLLQGVWAGVFLEHDGRREMSGTWITVHARGAEAAIALAAASAVVAFVRQRRRRELWIGSAGLTVLLVLEAYLGGLIRHQGDVAVTIVHVPLAMAVMALSAWLPIRSARRD